MSPGVLSTDTFVGTLNEDFAIESTPGDIFQLGNPSYQIVKVESGQVRVADAKGQPPTLPFWLGEAPGRTNELSEEVSRLRQDVADRLDDPPAAIQWLVESLGLNEPGARQIVEYLGATRQILGTIPTQQCLVLERFFDEAGGMQLVLDAPFRSRINRAGRLALSKRFCRSFNFELQAAATEDAIVLSLGPQHSFPLEDVFQYLKPETAEHLLVQAMLDAPMFGSRWRWNATRALAVLRARGGKKVPTPLQRMDAEGLVAAAFPDQLARPENPGGAPEIPDHPLGQKTIADARLATGAVGSAECRTRNAEWQGWFDELARAGRATTLLRDPRLWIAAERLPMLEAVFPGAKCEPALSVPERDRAKAWTREDAVRELVRGRLEAGGPPTAADVARSLGVAVGDVEFALGALEHEGFVLRGRFTPGGAELEGWR